MKHRIWSLLCKPIILLYIPKKDGFFLNYGFFLRQLRKGLNPVRPRNNQLQIDMIKESWFGPLHFYPLFIIFFSPLLPPFLPFGESVNSISSSAERVFSHFVLLMTCLFCNAKPPSPPGPISLWPQCYSGSWCWGFNRRVEFLLHNVWSSAGPGHLGKWGSRGTQSIGMKNDVCLNTRMKWIQRWIFSKSHIGEL